MGSEMYIRGGSTDGHRLTDRVLNVVHEADLVVHADDFVHESVLDASVDEADSFLAMYGNNDGSEIRDRIPTARSAIYGGVEFTMIHTRCGGNTALSMFGREREVDAVVFGHNHRPGFHNTESIPLLNPGGHAQPRDNRKAHVELEELPDDGLHGRLVTVNGETFKTFRIIPDE